jgi:hypothetical protein
VNSSFETWLEGATAGRAEPLYLIEGNQVLAEPAALRLGEALARASGCQVEVYRRPAELTSLLADLRTYSLFATAKVVVAIDSALLADRQAAADLIDEAAEVLPLAAPEDEPTSRERRASRRLLRALQLFQIDPYRGIAEEVLKQIPPWALQGGRQGRSRSGRARGSRQVRELRDGLGSLLELARRIEVESWAESELSELTAILADGLPEGHTLILTESLVAKDHPLAKALSARDCAVRVGEVTSQRGGGWQGLDLLAEELERETEVAIDGQALAELARRTLRQRRDRRASGPGVDSDSTARLAAEYRKLANLATDGRIDRQLVSATVEDRGEEDVWQLMDAVGAGRGGEALQRLSRLLASADDAVAARLSVFALLADFCRHLTTVAGVAGVVGVKMGQQHYGRFKSQVAPRLQVESAGGVNNPIAKLHPSRLHKAYLAASRVPADRLLRLPARVLEVELRLKGDSRAAETVLADFVAELALACR